MRWHSFLSTKLRYHPLPTPFLPRGKKCPNLPIQERPRQGCLPTGASNTVNLNDYSFTKKHPTLLDRVRLLKWKGLKISTVLMS